MFIRCLSPADDPETAIKYAFELWEIIQIKILEGLNTPALCQRHVIVIRCMLTLDTTYQLVYFIKSQFKTLEELQKSITVLFNVTIFLRRVRNYQKRRTKRNSFDNSGIIIIRPWPIRSLAINGLLNIFCSNTWKAFAWKYVYILGDLLVFKSWRSAEQSLKYAPYVRYAVMHSQGVTDGGSMCTCACCFCRNMEFTNVIKI